jgi:transposase
VAVSIRLSHPHQPGTTGRRGAGVDFGICNFAAVSFGGESVLYPGSALKEDEYYFTKQKAKCDDSSSRKAIALTGNELVAGHTSCTPSQEQS